MKCVRGHFHPLFKNIDKIYYKRLLGSCELREGRAGRETPVKKMGDSPKTRYDTKSIP